MKPLDDNLNELWHRVCMEVIEHLSIHLKFGSDVPSGPGLQAGGPLSFSLDSFPL